MRKPIFVAAALLAASILSACGPADTNSAANKPANAGNAAASNANAKPVDSAALDTEIKKLVTDAAASMSKNDAAAFEKMTTDNYMFISPDGKMATKAERLASLRSGESKYESVVYDEVAVRPNQAGTGAIVTARATVKGVNMGQKVDGQYRITQIWRKQDDGWKMAHGHATAIAASASSSSNSTPAANSAPAANSNTNK